MEIARAAELRAENKHLAQQTTLNLAQREQIGALERDQRDLQIRNRMLQSRVGELEHYADDNTSLREQCELLQSEVARLTRAQAQTQLVATPASNVEDLTSRRSEGQQRASNTSGTSLRVEPSGQTLESHLVNHLNQLVRLEPGITAVLSDDNGFPVVGVGPEGVQEGVCVLTSLAQELATRAVDFVDLERIRQMELVDQAGRALRVRFFTWQDQDLALGCLGASHLQPNLHEERVVTDFPNVLLQASSG